MLEILKSYRALVVALNEAKTNKNTVYKNDISNCIEVLKPEIDKFMDWVDDNVLKDFVEKFYLQGWNNAQYDSHSGSSYNCMRRVCRKACKKYDKNKF